MSFGDEARIDQFVGSESGGAGIFHATFDEFIHVDLRVLFPGIWDGEAIGKEIEHLFGAGKTGRDGGFHSARDFVGDWEFCARSLLFRRIGQRRG